MFWQKRNKNKEELYRYFSGKDIEIINYLIDGVLIFDKNNRLFLINPQAERFFEVRRGNVLGKAILKLNHFRNLQPLVSLLGGGIKEYSREELQIRENFILEVTSTHLKTKKEKNGTLVILHDISREKITEKMKSDIVTLTAHQLRTPTSAIKWTIWMLLRGEYGDMKEKQREILEKAYEINEKMIILINDLLNVARIEEGKYLSEITLSSIEKVILSVIDSYKDKIEKRNLRFKFIKPAKKLPKVMIDVESMEIAIGNILNNAISYTRPGGKISIFLKGNQRKIEVQIQDTGIGIPKHQQNKVFSTFFRGINAIRIETEGTGLGLFITKNIIEAHGGKIWFESEEGKGTTFYLTIPIKEKFGEFLTKEFY